MSEIMPFPKFKLAPFKCPECGSSERIALDFEATDRRYVLGMDEDGDPMLDEDAFDTIAEGGPQEFSCLECNHSWPFPAEGMKYDMVNEADVEIEGD